MGPPKYLRTFSFLTINHTLTFRCTAHICVYFWMVRASISLRMTSDLNNIVIVPWEYMRNARLSLDVMIQVTNVVNTVYACAAASQRFIGCLISISLPTIHQYILSSFSALKH